MYYMQKVYIKDFIHDISNYLQVLGFKLEFAMMDLNASNIEESYQCYEKVVFFITLYKYMHNLSDISSQDAIKYLSKLTNNSVNITIINTDDAILRIQCQFLLELSKITNIDCSIDNHNIYFHIDGKADLYTHAHNLMQNKYSDSNIMIHMINVQNNLDMTNK